MTFHTPRDEREWRAMVERQLRNVNTGLRSTVDAAVGPAVDGAIGGIVDQINQGSTLHPTKPIELTWQTALYLDGQGRYHVRFMLDFPDVIHSTDAQNIVVDKYELWGRPVSASLLYMTTDAVAGEAAPGATLPGLASTPANKDIAAQVKPWTLMATSTESAFRADGYDPGSLWIFRARALGRNMTIPGEWSDEITVQMVEDTTPPAQPSAPTLDIARGTITVRWDGQGVSGAMPADFRYAILAHGTDSSPTHEIARFGRGGGFWVVGNLPYYDPQFFRLKAVDESGNESPWSEQAVGYTTPLVDKDIILSEIDAATTYLHNIDAGVAILPNTILTEHLVVTEDMTARIANFLHVKADMLDVNEIWADSAWLGTADAILVRSEMFIGKEFFGGTFTGPLIQTDTEALTGIKIDSSGLNAWNTGGELTFSLDGTTGDVDILGTFQIGRVNEPYVLLTKNAWAQWPGIRFNTSDSGVYFQPTIFSAADSQASTYGWGVGDLILMGSEVTANNTPRSQLQLGARGAPVVLGRAFASYQVNNVDNSIRFEGDGSTHLLGHMRASTFNGATFAIGGTPQTNYGTTYFNVPITPPPYGAYWPSITADGLNPVSSATGDLSPSGFKIRFSGPDNNMTSFYYLLRWEI